VLILYIKKIAFYTFLVIIIIKLQSSNASIATTVAMESAPPCRLSFLQLLLPSRDHRLIVFLREMRISQVGGGRGCCHILPLRQNSVAQRGITVPLPFPSPWLIVF